MPWSLATSGWELATIVQNGSRMRGNTSLFAAVAMLSRMAELVLDKEGSSIKTKPPGNRSGFANAVLVTRFVLLLRFQQIRISFEM